HEALGNVLPLDERHGNQLAVDLRAHRHGVERLGGADAVEIDRHIGNARLDRDHRYRVARVAATAALALAFAGLAAGLLLLLADLLPGRRIIHDAGCEDEADEREGYTSLGARHRCAVFGAGGNQPPPSAW